MREKQLPVNENVFNALIMGHSNADDLESAVGILTVMSQAGLEPSADTYTTLLCGFARKGDIESIEKFSKQAEEKEVVLLDKDFLEVIYALAVNGHGDKADQVFLKLKKAFGYNQDAVNVILRLINHGQEETAFKILKTMPRGTRASGEMSDTGNFLIKQLVKANRPVEQILSICKELEEADMNSRPILVAVEASLTTGNSALMKALLAEMHTRGHEIRVHFFWPALCAAKTEKEILDICTSIQNDYKLGVTNQTIRDYVIPKILVNHNYSEVIQKLRSIGITPATACSTAAYVALNNHKMDKAAEIMGSFSAYFSPGMFRKSVLFAFAATKDFESYIKILRCIYDNMDRSRTLGPAGQKQEQEEDEDEAGEGAPSNSERGSRNIPAEVLGDMIIDALVQFKADRVEICTRLLQGLVDQGLTISSFKAEKIQDRLGESMTAEISTLLGKLASGELEPVHIERARLAGGSKNVAPADIESLERSIARMDEKGENSKGLKRQLLVSAIRARNIEKTEEIVERLKGEGYVLTSGVYAQLIELYASADKIDEAIAALKKIRETEPEFELDENKSVKVAQAYVNADRIDEAVKFLEDNKLKDVREEKQYNYQATCWRLLNSLAEKGNAAGLDKIFDALVANGFIVPNNVLLGALIKVHLVQDNLKAAVDKFEEISHKHRATPWKNDLACRLIQSEDAASLQRITDLSTEIHGEVNSLYDLVFSFIECGRVRQARKILETPGLRTRPGRINSACERYLNESMPTALEGLVEATKDLNHIDRAEIYYSLLQTYIKDVAPEKALNLWTTMQEEDTTPSDIFLVKLAEFLKQQGHEVPFHVPKMAELKKAETVVQAAQPVRQAQAGRAPRVRETQREQKDSTETVAALKTALKSEDIEAIMKAKQNLLPTDKLSLTDRSAVLEALVRSERLQEATKLVFEILDDKLTPLPSIFRFYLNRVAMSGDSDTLAKVGSQLSPEKKKLVSFDNRMCHSYVAGGKAEAYMQKLESIIDEATTEEQIKKADEEFPRGGSIGIIEDNPEYVEKFQKVAEKYAAKKILGPANVLWMHYFINKDPRAEEIFNKYLTSAPRLMFQRVIQIGRRNNDDVLVLNLVNKLNAAKVSEGAIGNAYSCLIDIYASKNDAEACLKTVNDCVKAVCFENVNRTALLRAKECVETAGLKFPHTIPEKKAFEKQDSSSSSSSSSSDDEVTKKKASSS